MTRLLVPEGRWTAEQREADAARRATITGRIVQAVTAGALQMPWEMRGQSRYADPRRIVLQPEATAAAERWILTGECDPS